jgi:hypothetical protein
VRDVGGLIMDVGGLIMDVGGVNGVDGDFRHTTTPPFDHVISETAGYCTSLLWFIVYQIQC